MVLRCRLMNIAPSYRPYTNHLPSESWKEKGKAKCAATPGSRISCATHTSQLTAAPKLSAVCRALLLPGVHTLTGRGMAAHVTVWLRSSFCCLHGVAKSHKVVGQVISSC